MTKRNAPIDIQTDVGGNRQRRAVIQGNTVAGKTARHGAEITIARDAQRAAADNGSTRIYRAGRSLKDRIIPNGYTERRVQPRRRKATLRPKIPRSSSQIGNRKSQIENLFYGP